MQAQEVIEINNGYFVRVAREKAGLTPKEASIRLNIGTSTLYRYENESPPGRMIIEMANLYRDRKLLYRCITNGIIWRELGVEVNYGDWNQTIANLMRENKQLDGLIPELVEMSGKVKRLPPENRAVIQQMIASLVEVMEQTEGDDAHG